MHLTGLPWRPNISNTSATEGAQSASATAQLPAESLKRLASNPSSQAEGSSSQRSMPAGTPLMTLGPKMIGSYHACSS